MTIQIQSERVNPLTPEQIKQYHEDGFIIIKNGCSDDLIDAFNSHIHAIRSSEAMPEWAKPRKGGAVVDDKDRFSLRLFNPHLHDGFSLQMMKLPVVRGALAQVLGDEATGVQSMYFYKEPGSPGQAAHQDYYYIKNDPNTLTAAWVAMEYTNEENGCLYVIPGSQKLGVLPHGDVKNLQEHEAWTHEVEGIDLSKEIPVILDKGDILIFDSNLIHSSTRNRSNRWRRSYVCHYIRHDSTIEREDLKKKISLV
ncbi:phytanoyl-CoA dioxygenase family protein [Paenibacillus anseongense]|uniref:phytanoyl-CoA dioxygenase family protein n=1 Tax=Paenibacillus TaxID=44249 RepID=UPI002DBEDCEF|nr:phytanoyl-CoA dioxygenase family protein [Paenibacillus anseongense]MEC0266392.1 phytanoyl-CoA dioxygenase family protein [Paenibacillus anseongense]